MNKWQMLKKEKVKEGERQLWHMNACEWYPWHVM